jgi:DNA polymerase III subunit delta'
MAEVDDEPDRRPGAPHPRQQTALFGHEAAETALLDAYRAGQLHHAWLIGGAEGIGKATFAYRVARFLIAHPDPASRHVREARSLAVEAGHPAWRALAHRAHPDVAVLRRGWRKDGKGYMGDIAVGEVRRALDLFGSTAGAGGYRICIVDSADDLNASSANALLKVIEEPPARSLFLVVAHAPARVLATIRSRCRSLTLRPLGAADVVRALGSLGPPWSATAAADLGRAADLSQGSVGKALALLDADVVGLVEQVRAALDRLPEVQPAALYALAEVLAGRRAEEDFDTAFGVVTDWIADTVRARAGEGAACLAPLVEVWEKSARAAREARVFNLDRRPLVISMFGDLADAVRRSRAA